MAFEGRGLRPVTVTTETRDLRHRAQRSEILGGTSVAPSCRISSPRISSRLMESIPVGFQILMCI